MGIKALAKARSLKVAYIEDQENNILSLWLRPDDVRGAVPELAKGDLNTRIDSWKRGLTQLIAREISESYAEQAISTLAPEKMQGRLFDIIDFAKEIFSKKINQGVSLIKQNVI